MKVITVLNDKLLDVIGNLSQIVPSLFPLLTPPLSNDDTTNTTIPLQLHQQIGPPPPPPLTSSLVENSDVQQIAEQVQYKLTQLDKVYNRNILFIQFRKKLVSFGFSMERGFSLELLKLMKKTFKAFVDDFKQSEKQQILNKLFEEVYFPLPLKEYHQPLETIIEYISNHQKAHPHMQYSKLSFFQDEYYDENEIDMKMLLNRKKLEQDTILFDNVEGKLWWTKDSIEDFVHHFKLVANKKTTINTTSTSSNNTTNKSKSHNNRSHNNTQDLMTDKDEEILESIHQLIFSIRKLQIHHIIEVNKVDYQFFESLGVNPMMKKKLVAVMKKDKENNKLRNLFSKGFNSNAFHFILEFIQNSDDAEFDENVDPSLHFTFSKNHLCISSNEKGFSYDNLFSLAGIASSDKIEKKLEKKSIGEKGLGFKTIFSVCDNVKLYSNGFCARLSPEHLEEIPSNNNRMEEGTKFELQTKTFSSKTFDKYILLTLKKLNCISFQEENFKEIYRKRREGNDIILESDIGGTKTFEKFLCVEKTINMSDIIEEKRLNYTDAILQLYLPYSGKKLYNLHAYLPVNNIGLSFIIQSDFVLSQNRESVVVNEWNGRIISEIPKLFTEAFEKILMYHPHFKKTYLSLIQKQPSESFPSFSNVINNIQTSLFELECIPIISDENVDKLFAKPKMVIRIPPEMKEINPFEIFGPSVCYSLLKKYGLHPSIDLSDDFLKIPVFNQNNLISLLNGIGEKTIIKKIESVCSLIKHFNIDTRKHQTLAIIPTQMGEVVTSNEKVYYSAMRLPKPLIESLKENGYHVLSQQVHDNYSIFHPLHPPFPFISDEIEFIFTILRSGKNASNQHVPFKILTTNNNNNNNNNGEWKLSNSVFEYNKDSKLLSNVSFADTNEMLKILLKFGLKINPEIFQDILTKCGVRKLPIISGEFIEKFEDWKTLLTFVSNNWSEYYFLGEQKSIIFHINNSMIGSKKISDLYDPSLKKFLKNNVEYIPSLKPAILKQINYTKEMDLNSYTACILDAKQNLDINRIIELLNIMEQSLPFLHVKTFLSQTPVLYTTTNEFFILDDEVLFKHVPPVLFEKYILKELHPKFHPLCKKFNIPTIPERIIFDELLGSTSTLYPFYENLLHYLIKYSSDMSKYLQSNIIYYEGKKVSMRDVCWKLDKLSVKMLPNTVMILSKYYKDGVLASYYSQHTSEANIESEIYRYYTDLIDKIVKDGDSNITRNDRDFLINVFEMIEKKIFGYFPLIKVKMIWEADCLSGIPMINNLCLNTKFTNRELSYKAEKMFKENNLLLDRLPSDFIIEFLTRNNNVQHFIQVCEYIEENGYKFSANIDAPVIICGNDKFKPSQVVIQRLDSSLKCNFLSIMNFYEKHKRVISACRLLGVRESLSVENIQKMIVDLQSVSDVTEGHLLCHTLYTIVNNYLLNGLVSREEITNLKNAPIFRDTQGKHHVYNSKICLNDDEVLYQEFKSDLIILCIPFVSSNSISKFCETMNINGIEKNIKYQMENVEIVTSGGDYLKLIEERIKSLLLFTNYYCKFRGYPHIKEETVKVCGAKNLSILANFKSGEISMTKRVKSSVFIDKHKIIVDVEAELDDIVNNKFFNSSFLQFYNTNETNKYELSNLIDVLAPKTNEQMLSYFKRKGYRMDLKLP